MKIVHLCLSAFFIDNYSYQENMLPKYHVKMGHKVTVIASLFSFNKEGKGCFLDEPSEYNDKNGYHVIRLAYKSPVKINKTLRHYEGTAEVLEKESPDVIFLHNISFADISILEDYLKRYPGVKVYADNHADFVNSAKNFMSKYILHPIIWRYYAKKIEPYLTKCFGVTPMRCRFLSEMYHISKDIIEFLPMGVDDDAIPLNRSEVRSVIRMELGIPMTDKVILTGGKIDILKNIHILIEALKKRNDGHLHLIICGTFTPEMEYLKKSIEAMPNIHYLGWCNAEKVMDCMVAADVACFPGTHSTLWEQSVGVGLPAIFKRWKEMEHVNVNGNCIFVRGDDVDELSNAICKMQIEPSYNEYLNKASVAAKSFLYSEIAKKAISQ